MFLGQFWVDHVLIFKAVLAYVAYTWSWSDSGKSYWGESEYASPTLYGVDYGQSLHVFV